MYQELNTILFGTENLITHKNIVDNHVIYNVYTDNVKNTSAVVYFKFLKKLSLKDFKIIVQTAGESPVEYNVDLTKGSYFIPNLKKSTKYNVRLEVTQEGDPDFSNSESQAYSETSFKTL